MLLESSRNQQCLFKCHGEWINYNRRKAMAAVLESAVEESRIWKLESDIAVLKSDVAHVQSDITEMKTDIRDMRKDFGVLWGDVVVLRDEIHTGLGGQGDEMHTGFAALRG